MEDLNFYSNWYIAVTQISERTFIDTAPQDQEVNATMDVVFECGATTDPLEAARLEIKWKRDGDEIDFKVQKRLRYNVNDHTLTIIGSEVTDSGEYTCVADNGLDSDEVTAQLTVKGKGAQYLSALILGLSPAYERCHYKVMPSLIGWAQT